MPFYSFLLCFLAFLPSIVSAQRPPQGPPQGRIDGQIIDAKTKEAVAFATVALYRLRDSVAVSGGLSDEQGRFVLEEIPFGGYWLQVDFMGYQSYQHKPLIIKPDQMQVKLGQLSLETSAQNLGEVVAQGEAAEMRLAIDRKIFDVEKSQLATGGTATDVLRNTPTLEVDAEGSISLRGSAGVTVFINGRPSALAGGDRKALLDQIPANMVKRVEIITNPSAKYDPDGISGIINIVLKKNNLEGFSGNVSATVGTVFDKYNATAGLSYRNRNFNIGLSYNYQDNTFWRNGYSLRTNKFGPALDFLDQYSNGLRRRSSHFARLQGEWSPKENQTLAFGFSLSPQRGREYDTLNYEVLNANRDYLDAFDRYTDENESGLNSEATLNYTLNFNPQGDHQLVIDASFSNNQRSELAQYQQVWWDNQGQARPNLGLNQTLDEGRQNQVWTAQADYTRPLKQGKLELGAKTIIRNIDNSLFSKTRDTLQTSFREDVQLNNDFSYREAIHALYATYGHKWGKFGLQAGLRLEQAFTTSELKTTNETFENNYFSPFPSLHLSYQVKPTRQMMLAYSRRINRPGTWSLNPFPNFDDPLNLRRGNPFLLPEYIESVELTLAEYWSKASVSASAYYRHTSNLMQRIRTVEPTTNVATTTFENLASNNAYGLEAVFSFRPYAWWRGNASLNAYYFQIDGSNLDNEFANAAFAFSMNLGSTFQLGKGWSSQFNAFYRPAVATAQGQMKYMFNGTVSLTKALLKEKLLLSLRLEDPFYWSQFGMEFNQTLFDQDILRRWESRVLYATVSYQFGKLEERKARSGRGGRRGGGMGDGGGGDMDF